MKGLGQLMKQAQAMQENLHKAQQELAELEVEGQAGGGMVRIRSTCKHEVRGVSIEDSLLSDDKDMLEDLIAAAINDVNRKIDETVQERMSGLTGGLPLPDGFKMPF
jgi:DNA-binding YbaB/EbfC family protein